MNLKQNIISLEGCRMSGTSEGGLKASQTIYKYHGKDFYREIGRKGGQNGHTGGFAANPELAKKAGAKGGRISKRGKAKDSNMKITLTISQEQLNYILEYARTKSITTACNLATSLVEQLEGKKNG